MKNSTAVVIGVLIIMGTAYFVMRDTSDVSGSPVKNVAQNSYPSNNAEQKNEVTQGGENSVMKDGVQYVTITARGGYSPRESSAKAGVPTKLVIKTNGTYDCSAALSISSFNFRKMLPNTGETIVDAGTPKVGDVIRGVCAMGMYSFAINFIERKI